MIRYSEIIDTFALSQGTGYSFENGYMFHAIGEIGCSGFV